MNVQLRRKDQTIYILFYRQDSRVLFSSGLKCGVKQWNEKGKKLRLNTAADYELHEKITAKLSRIEKICLQNPTVNNTELKTLLKQPVIEESFWQDTLVFLEFIKNTGTSLRYTRYKDILAKLKIIDSDLTWATIDMKLYDKIIAYYHEKEYAINYRARQIKYMKTFFNWGANRGYLTNYSYKNFKSQSVETEVLFLTEAELEAIAIKEMPSSKLDRTRDLFVFMCYTGLRHSDAVSIMPVHIQGKFIQKTTVKTSDPNLIIPLVGHAFRLVQKYEGNLPKISSQKMNDYLSEVGEIAKVNTPTETIQFKTTGQVSKTVPKYKLITSKMARKTFVTLSLAKGIPAEVIMSMTGHKKHEVMRKYLKVTNTLKFNEMNKWT